MKTLIAFLLTASVALGQTVSPAARDGSNITNGRSTWSDNILPAQATHAGKYLKTDGTDATWETVTSDLTSGPVTSSGGVSAIADAALSIAKTSGLESALNAKQTAFTLSNCNLVVEGDSKSSDTSPTAGAGNTWPAQFMTLPVATGGTLFNYAINGRALSAITSNYATEAYTKRPAATGKVAYLSVRTGANDESSDMSAFWTALQSHWSTARTDGFKIIAWTLTLRAGQTNAVKAEIHRINNLIRAASDKWDYLIDAENAIPGPGNATYFLDAIHETTEGNRVHATLLQAILRGDTVQPIQTGDMAKQASNALAFTGGGGTLTDAVTMSGGAGYPLTLSGSTVANLQLAVGGVHFFNTYLDGGSATFGFLHRWNSGSLQYPVYFAANNENSYFRGDVRAEIAGKTLLVKSGTNAAAGTVVLSSGAGTITSTAITANAVIVLSLKTPSGTPGTYAPRSDVAAGSATITGLSTDNSTYNWVALKVN